MVVWPTVPIGELFRLKQGTYLKPEEMSEAQTDDFPFPVYGANGIIGYSNRKMYSERTTLVSCRGANCGVVHYTVPNVWISNNSIACVPTAEIDPTFYYYVCLNTDFGDVITGSAQPQITITNLSSKRFINPPLPAQHRIAGILSAYDELIENNQRRIRILEEMARSLYREWFVHFRYPGHESVPLFASPLGQIPQGWEVKPAPECIAFNPRVTVPRDGEKPFVPMGCLSNDSMLISGIESRSGNSGAKFQNGDTLFARITPCLENGKTGFVQFLPNSQDVAFGSTEFIVLRSRTLTPEFVYCLARSDEFRNAAIKSMSGATGRQRVQEKCFDAFQIAQPPRELLDRFTRIVAPSFRLIHGLHHQIENLRRTRDLLLPRLLSGKFTCCQRTMHEAACD